MPLRSSPEHADDDVDAARDAAHDIALRTRRALRRSAKILLHDSRVQHALEPFKEEGVQPSRVWLKKLARTAWQRKWENGLQVSYAISLYARAGATEELNRIGEFLTSDLQPWGIDAFIAAGNCTRLREVGEDFLRNGVTDGLRCFEFLDERPSDDLIRAYAYATLKNLERATPMLEAVRRSGITLSRHVLLAAERRYRTNEASADADLLLAAANDSSIAVDAEGVEPPSRKRKR